MDKFFIVGCPRSGTTMLQQALNRHPCIVIPPETKFFFSFFGHPHKAQARHVERLNADLGIRLPTPATRVRASAEARAFYDEMARQYVERVGKRDVVLFGEKTPEHTGHLPRIRALFPEAKIVVLYRDGRDVATSLTHMPWMSSDLYVNFAIWLYYTRLVRRVRDEAWPGVYFIRYEDVVSSPRKELAALLDFLGLSYEPAVAEGWGNREGVPEREHPWKARALQKITSERVGVFRRELTTEQIENLERMGGHALRAFGYDLITGGEGALSPAFLLKLTWGLSRFACRLPRSSVVGELACRVFSDRSPAPTVSLGLPPA